jgi:hypothetical protein
MSKANTPEPSSGASGWSHDLLPCPFCGCLPRLTHEFPTPEYIMRHTADCYLWDGWGGRDLFVAEKLGRWNTRAGHVADDPSAAGDGE